jgi:hypothetical protein
MYRLVESLKKERERGRDGELKRVVVAKWEKPFFTRCETLCFIERTLTERERSTMMEMIEPD